MPFSWKDENTPQGYANETLPCRLCKKPVLPSTAGKTGGLCLECDHEERRRIEHEARVSHPGCPACDGSTRASAFSFDWEAARAGRGDMGKYPTYLRPQHRVKRGSR